MAREFEEPLIKGTAQYIRQKFGNFDRIEQLQQVKFDLEGERHFGQITPWRDKLGLDWLVIVTMPESDFMAEINENSHNTIW